MAEHPGLGKSDQTEVCEYGADELDDNFFARIFTCCWAQGEKYFLTAGTINNIRGHTVQNVQVHSTKLVWGA